MCDCHDVWRSGGDSDDIYYATSEDGLNWVAGNNGDPVIELGPDSTWNDHWVYPSGLILLNGTLHMFLTGHDGTGQFQYMRTGYAWSDNYTDWNMHENYVLDVINNDDYESKQVCAHTVLLDDEEDSLSMWYTGLGDLNYWAVCQAKAQSPTVHIDESKEVMSSFKVYPNPIFSTSEIKYYLTNNSPVTIQILDVNGRVIETLVEEQHQQGEHKTVFNAPHLSPGIYFCTLKTIDRMQTRKLIKL